MSRTYTNQPVNISPSTSEYLFAFNNNWHRSFCGSFRTCPRTAYACLCNPCYTAKLIDRTGEKYWIGCLNPCSLMTLRTKVRTTFRIRGGLVGDCCLTCSCLAPCAVMQVENELDYQGIPTIRGKRVIYQ